MRVHIFAGACAAILCCASAGAQAASCVKAGGEATMITEDLAKFMANAALNNQMSANSLKPAGEVSMTCSAAAVGTYCIAQQRACKS
jgi:hypothetical protein